MKTFSNTCTTVLVVGALTMATNCAAASDPAASSAGDKAVSIQFAALNGNAPVKCGTRLSGVGNTGANADVKDLRFYITKLALVTDKGVAVPVKLDSNVWQLTHGPDAVALIDLEDASSTCASAYNTAATNAHITGKVSAGHYVGLQASMGVPDSLTHTATVGSPPPLDIAAMSWSWQAGRRFAKIELNPVGGVGRMLVPKGASEAVAGNSPTFNLHLGSSGCIAKVDAAGMAVKDAAGNPSYTCSNPNVVDFKLAQFDVASQQVALDIGQLFKTVNLSKDGGGAAGCMAGPTDPECTEIFKALQVSFGSGSSGLPINGGAAQTVFRAVAK
jgi:uncharacterized repeat protein (TIGR04052 family)